MLVAGHSALESAALTVRAMPVYEKPPARPVDTYYKRHYSSCSRCLSNET